jgi:plasmid stabilization system protein ParE
MTLGSMDSVSDFLSAVEQTVGRLSEHPEAGAPLSGELRKRIVRGFPYNVIYRVWEDYIYLVAVAHQHRRPGYWRDRSSRR